jgi:hypothetical protein
MSESPSPETRKNVDHEFQDPHFHDEEPEIQSEDQTVKRTHTSRRKPVRKMPPPRRRFFED